MKFRFAAMFSLLFFSLAARAQTAAFSYQGELADGGNPANGNYDLRFELFDVNSNIVAGPITNAPVGVTNGIFSTTLDFGGAVFDGSDRWLQIAVRSYGDTNAYTALSPLQPITSTPYAIRAASAANAAALTQPLEGTNIVGIVPVANLPANIALLDSNEIFSGAISATNPANVLGGDGSHLKNLTATNVVGILPDANLSTNVALQSDTVLNFSGSVAATNFIGAGHGLTNVPGAFFWVKVSGSITASPNVGYICANDVTPVTITLPASMSVGDTFKVAGIGAAGWVIAQNSGQTIFSGNLSSSIGQDWKATGSSQSWTAIASSADGTKLAATTTNGSVYISTDSGADWVAKVTGMGNLSAIASSSDGTKLVAVAGYTIHNISQTGYIYTSANSGADWTTRATDLNKLAWSSVASSADGGKLIAAVRGGAIYLSSNSGSSWLAVSGTSGLFWNSVASSSDGTKLVAVEGNGLIATSTNSGSLWLARTNVGSSVKLDAVTCSSDGQRMIATTGNGSIYISTDSGVTWLRQSSGVSAAWIAIASSADGSRLAAAAGGSGVSGNIFNSANSGASWTQAGAPSAPWSDITSSADGSVLAATVYGGNIYVSSQNSTTTGAAGYLSGAQHSAIELIYVGDGNFLPLNHEGTIRAY